MVLIETLYAAATATNIVVIGAVVFSTRVVIQLNPTSLRGCTGVDSAGDAVVANFVLVRTCVVRTTFIASTLISVVALTGMLATSFDGRLDANLFDALPDRTLWPVLAVRVDLALWNILAGVFNTLLAFATLPVILTPPWDGFALEHLVVFRIGNTSFPFPRALFVVDTRSTLRESSTSSTHHTHCLAVVEGARVGVIAMPTISTLDATHV